MQSDAKIKKCANGVCPLLYPPGMGPAGMSLFFLGLKLIMPHTAKPITITAISTYLVVLFIRIGVGEIRNGQIYSFDRKNKEDGIFCSPPSLES